MCTEYVSYVTDLFPSKLILRLKRVDYFLKKLDALARFLFSVFFFLLNTCRCFEEWVTRV